ncbi:hypothetical protein [Parapedobacter tibetensis]|uniref:hypothetical protein n=1 Tax=Parapedobacter tibetensis TaxID=2972951 RepID=UPI00214D8DBF|nr:hypothetical protein [Parapedobacter tibetensis]
MKGSILTVMVVLMAIGLSFAQQRGGRGFGNPEENAKRTSEQLEKELKLSAAQKDSVYAFTLEQSKAMQQAFQNNQDGDRSQMMGKMRELREQTDKKILSVLDDDQKKGYEKMVKERANRMRQGGGQRGGGRNG